MDSPAHTDHIRLGGDGSVRAPVPGNELPDYYQTVPRGHSDAPRRYAGTPIRFMPLGSSQTPESSLKYVRQHHPGFHPPL
jgi:hypothetical protein